MILYSEERAELFTAARLALVENPTRFVLGRRRTLSLCEIQNVFGISKHPA
jgi:hypothetical protein